MTESEKYEKVVNELLEQISERNKRIATLNTQLEEKNNYIAVLSEQVTELKQQLSAVNKLQRMILQIRRRLLPGEKNH